MLLKLRIDLNSNLSNISSFLWQFVVCKRSRQFFISIFTSFFLFDRFFDRFFILLSMAHKLGATLIIIVSLKVNIEKDFSYALRGTTIATNLFRSRGWFCPFHGLPHPTPSFWDGWSVCAHAHALTRARAHTHTRTHALAHTYTHAKKQYCLAYKAQMLITLFQNASINCVPNSSGLSDKKVNNIARHTKRIVSSDDLVAFYILS